MGDSFHAHVELLQLFLAHRDEIVERIQGLLNAQRKPIQYLQDVPLLSRQFEDCFFTLPGVNRDQSLSARKECPDVSVPFGCHNDTLTVFSVVNALPWTVMWYFGH